MFEVETSHLTEREDTMFTLEVESQEDGYLGAVLVGVGEEVSVGKPIAVVCDQQQDIDNFKSYSTPNDKLAAKQIEERMFLWQAYVKSHKSLDM